ncbi:MAG TPA: hypothetical protein VFF67_06520 [Thermoplasmata archaeon]|nr:hypothetical protein [Thermoplasmata archaeon]
MRTFLGPRSGPVPPSRPSTIPPARAGAGFPFAEELDRARSFDEIYRVVRRAVRDRLGQERPGLGLGLADLPPSLGAYWQVTGNLIVMNDALLRMMRATAESPRQYNSFVFVILAHEYLHALGYLEEGAVRPVTAQVARAAFGADHPATRMAEGDLWRMFPWLQYARGGDGQTVRVVRGFDLESTNNYIR